MLVGIFAVGIAVVALVSQTRAQRRTAEVSRLTAQETRLTGRIERLQRIAAANIAMTTALAEHESDLMPLNSFYHAKNDLMVALTAFELGELPDSEKLGGFNDTLDKFPKFRDATTNEVQRERLATLAERAEVTAQLEELLAPGRGRRSERG